LSVVRSFAACVDTTPTLPATDPALLPNDPLRVRAGGGVLLLRRLPLPPPMDGLPGTRNDGDLGVGTEPGNGGVAGTIAAVILVVVDAAAMAVVVVVAFGCPAALAAAPTIAAAAAAAAAMLTAVPASRRISASEKVIPHGVVSSSVDMPSITVHSLPSEGSRNDSPLPPPPPMPLFRRRSWSDGEGHVAASMPPLSSSPHAAPVVPVPVAAAAADADAGAAAVAEVVLNCSSGIARIEIGKLESFDCCAGAIGCASSTTDRCFFG